MPMDQVPLEDQPVQTGLVGLEQTAPASEPTQVQAAPKPGVSLTAAEQREAELAEGARQNARQAHMPQQEHPATAKTFLDLQIDPNLDDAQQRAIDLLRAAVPQRVRGETIEQRIVRQDAEGRVEAEQQKHDFVRRVMASRQQTREDDAPKAPQPVPLAISKQTEMEMAAGRKANERHAAFHAQKPMPSHPDPTTAPSQSTPVFRPENYVPKFNQGNVRERTLT